MNSHTNLITIIFKIYITIPGSTFFHFSIQLGMSSSQLTPLFFREVENPTNRLRRASPRRRGRSAVAGHARGRPPTRRRHAAGRVLVGGSSSFLAGEKRDGGRD